MEGMEYFFAKCAEHEHSTQLSLNHTAYMAEDIFVRAGTKKKKYDKTEVREKYLLWDY